MELTQEYLKSILNYNKDTGIFTWKETRNGFVKAGDVAGSVSKQYGYIIIGIAVNGTNRVFKAHRLAWLYGHGLFPSDQLDHTNHDRSDNRIINLEEANNASNQRNTSIRTDNKSGINGVRWNKVHKKWYADIRINGRYIYLGLKESKKEAICARLHANRLYKFHANHGK